MPENKGSKWKDRSGLAVVGVWITLFILLLLFKVRSPVIDDPQLQFALHLVFILGVGIVIGALSSKSYLESGPLNILFLGASLLVYGVVTTISEFIRATGGTSYAAIGNLGVFLSTFLMFGGAVLTLLGTISYRRSDRRFILSSLYTISALAIIIIILIAEVFVRPYFLSQTDSSALRQGILLVAFLFVLFSCAIIGRRYMQTRSSVLYWFVLALALLVVALISAVFFQQQGDPMYWTSRTSQYLSGIFFLIAIRSVVTEEDTDASLPEKYGEAFGSDIEQTAVLFKNMFNSFAFHRIVTDNAGKPVDYIFLDVNDAFEKSTGIKREEAIGRRVTEVIPGIAKDPTDWIGIYGRVALQGESVQFENHDPAFGKWFRISAYSPRKRYFITIFDDITERREAEFALLENEQRLRSHVENTPMAVVEWDSDFKVTRWAGEAESIFGWSASEAVGKPVMDLNMIYEPDISIVNATIAKLTDGLSKKVVSTNRNVTRDGRIITCTWYNSALMDEKGRTTSVLSMVLDISARVQAEKELKDNADRLAISNAELQQFAYVASHDLQEPLRMVVSYLTLLERKYNDAMEPNAREYIKNAVEGGERMRALIDALLAYSRLDTKGEEFQKVDMGEVVDKVIMNLKVLIEETKSEIVIVPMPIITADESQMVQLLQNLVGNAIKFRKAERPKVHISAERNDDMWKFAVADNGIGLDTRYSERVFQMFQRLHTKEEYPGTGVGLAVAKKIVEHHGGRIWFESEAGQGTTFYFTINAIERSVHE